MIDSKVPRLDSQSTSESPQPDQMADASAEKLMDDLFDNVERALEGDEDALQKIAQLPTAEPAPNSELMLGIADPAFPMLVGPVGEEPTTDLTTLAASLAPVEPESKIADEAAVATLAPARAKQFWTVNRALLGAAGLMLLATFGVWLQQRQPAELAVTTPAAAPAAAPVTHAEFLEYLRRSLDVIAQNVAANPPVTTTDVGDVAIALNGNSAAGLPPIGNSALPPGVSTGLPTAPGSVNVIERVYVPYPTSQAPTAAPPTATATAPVNQSGNAVASNSAMPSTPHTLLGVLELGDRSAALVEIAGVPQRVYIGERVGNSGWSLVSVANEEAVVRRNGEVRTLYIGQQF